MSTVETTSIDDQVASLVGDVKALPTPPLVFAQINRVVNDENTSAFDVAAILAEDLAMSAKVLKLSNSAFYGFANPVPSVRQAIVMLGMNEVKNIVLSASALGAFAGKGVGAEYQEQFWRHSLAAAVAGRMMIRVHDVSDHARAETAFSAGLLHDIGRMVLACYAPEKLRQILAVQAERQLDSLRAEEEVLGFNHTHVGSFLARCWNLPGELIEAIEYHHTPFEAESQSIYPIVTHLADYFAHMTFAHDQLGPHEQPPPDPEALKKLGIRENDHDQIREVVAEEFIRSETFLRMASG